MQKNLVDMNHLGTSVPRYVNEMPQMTSDEIEINGSKACCWIYLADARVYL